MSESSSEKMPAGLYDISYGRKVATGIPTEELAKTILTSTGSAPVFPEGSEVYVLGEQNHQTQKINFLLVVEPKPQAENA